MPIYKAHLVLKKMQYLGKGCCTGLHITWFVLDDMIHSVYVVSDSLFDIFLCILQSFHVAPTCRANVEIFLKWNFQKNFKRLRHQLIQVVWGRFVVFFCIYFDTRMIDNFHLPDLSGITSLFNIFLRRCVVGMHSGLELTLSS